MCLGVPGRVAEIRDEAGLLMGSIDFGEVRRDACLDYLPDVEVGDFVLVHAGFAVNRIDEAEALKTLELLNDAGVMEPGLMPMGTGEGGRSSADAGGAFVFDPALPPATLGRTP
jgi:hydrogenase expression/formation protein HypC